MRARHIVLFVSLFAALALCAGCAILDTTTNPKASLAQFKKIYVEHRLVDDHHLDELIVAELQSHGHEASCGPLTMKPAGTDALVTYEDRWGWDFKSYLLEITIYVRDARTNQPVASGTFRRGIIPPKTPVQMIHEAIVPLETKPTH